ncbi:uncharacterized protein LOC129757288 isoform X2 [Uranotaenia lowii]|uniref:uncharacterized protein LOC129757288 isoform X2 n=1 Tax=Uranotaenia lowii TaxID=190385 RepID=UPI002479A369|nr:uncharacterized protein LOC129757288 isoform X2 [Uranotaenia lowii]
MEDVVVDDFVGETIGSDQGGFPPLPPPGDGNFKMPSLEDFIKMLETMDNLSDEEKEQLKQDVMRNSMRTPKVEAAFSDYIIFLTMVVLIASVFVFFGYKLYLSLTEKERKREEKLKAKQAKKKK